MAGEIYTYPNDLKIHGRALCISPLGITVEDRFSQSKQKRLAYIFLPIPHGLRTAYSARWGQEELGVVAGQAMKQIRDKNLDLSALAGSAGAKIIQNLGSMASGYIGVDINKLTSYAAKGLLNPNYALIFSGINFRVFNFSYRFVARNKSESDQIKQIVDTLKYYMSPSVDGSKGGEYAMFTKQVIDAGGNALGNGKVVETGKEMLKEGIDQIASNFMQYPNLFRLDFITERVNAALGGSDVIINNDKNKYLFQPGMCALQTLDVNYGTEGTPAFFKETGAPVTVSIDLSFMENEIVTKESIESKVGPS